ncbi:MAG: efflux RND transporter permease subunit, partial [Candidatus Krumholzibacteria bacterium]|nr:efflux RND transporter permease subunit [Candidatus Krumholzibacteria bacterium]
IDLAIHGHVDEASLKALGDRVRDELTAIRGISQVDLVSARPYEISIEVSENALRRHGLTFSYVANAVRRSSLDLPGGSLRTAGGEILLRTKAQAYRGHEFEGIVLLTRPDGTRLLLGDVARVVDGFAETDQSARFSGEPAVGIRVFRVGDQSALKIAQLVKEYVAEAQSRMPAGVTLTPWRDYSRILQGRLDLMIKSARNGYILVFIILALFLKLRLAWWVSFGIPISFLGALWLMPSLDVTINMISLFAFIVVLGIVVDDAIIVGENIYRHHEKGNTGVKGSVEGAIEVATPVIFGVLTTIAAFSPLLLVAGTTGKIMKVIPIIVISTLVFSLVESLFILPAHLARVRHKQSKSRLGLRWKRFQGRIADWLSWFIESVYKPSLDLGLRYRYATTAFATATLLITAGIVGAGWIKFTFFPKVESDFVSAALEMPPGTSIEQTRAAIEAIEDSALRLQAELDQEFEGSVARPVKYIFTAIGDQPLSARRSSRGHGSEGSGFAMSNLGEVAVELAPSEDRAVTSPEIASRWRDMTPPIPDVVSLTFSASIFSPGEPINVQLTGLNIENLQAASERLKRELTKYAGVFDIADSYRVGKQEIKLKVKPAAESFGVTQADLARQVRQAFYGEEAQRIQRGRDDVRVMVRYPEEQRRSVGDLENMRIRTSGGGEVPFHVVAETEIGRGYASIRRIDRQRAINVTADVDVKQGNAAEVLADLKAEVLPLILADYPGVSYTFEGEQREQAETMGGLIRGFGYALLAIFALMAIPFRSYIQPLIVMSVIPFGIVGAIWGHLIMRMDLTILSMFGVVALAGVVVNDSIVLVHYINRRRAAGVPVEQAVRDAGVARFRAILLTSVTTFAGLSPLLFARSVQAKFMVPMAVSLGFGVIFATFITLMIVPVSYLILEDVKRLAARVFGRRIEGPEPMETPAVPTVSSGGQP